MLSRFYVLCVALLLLPYSGFGELISIDYSVAQVGTAGNTYIYDYTVVNNGTPGTADVELFDIYFDPSLYQQTSLTNVTPNPLNSLWMPEILSSVGTAPAAFDAESLPGLGIAAGTSLSGFAVEFKWLGQGTPGVQPFEIESPSNFSTIEFGVTIPPAVAPEPPTGPWMLGVFLVCGIWKVRRQLMRPFRLG